MSPDIEKLLFVVGIGLFAGTVGTILASLWYRTTQEEPLTWDSVFVFAKFFYGTGGAAVLLFLAVKYL
jgi:hypothetical protein